MIIFFILTLLFSLLIQIFLDYYNLANYMVLAQLVPGILAIVMMFAYEEAGVGAGMIARRIIPNKRPTFSQILTALLPLLIFPVGFFLFKYTYNPYLEPVKLNLFVLLFPVLGAFAEELGWRGYLLNKAGSVMPIILATLLTGAMWFFGRAYFFIEDIFLGITYFFLCIIINFILSYLFFIFNRNILLTFIFQIAYSYMFIFFIALAPADERFVFYLLLLFLLPAVIIVLKNKSLFQIDKNDDL